MAQPRPRLIADSLLDVAIEKAPALRAAGVTRIAIEGLSLDLAPPEPPAIEVDGKSKPEPIEPLADPATYGLPAGAALPGFGDPEGYDEPE